MDYSNIIKRAAQITWQYKFLWPFGIIMTLCGQGSGGGSRFQMNYQTPYDPGMGPPEFPAFFPEPLGQTPIAVYIVAGILFLIIFGLIGILVGAIGRGSLIKSVERIENGEELSFRQSWRDGLEKVVPLGLLQLLLSIPGLILGIIAAVIILTLFWPFFSQLLTFRPPANPEGPPPFMREFLTIFPLFFAAICAGVCLTFILQIITGFFLTFGSRAIVLENQGVIGSFGRGWQRFRQNIGATVILAILIVVIGFGVSIIVGLPSAVIMLPLMMSTMPRIFSEAGPSLGDYLLLGCAGLTITLIFSIIGGIIQVFIESLWTLAYREFTKYGQQPLAEPLR
jgi:hypothetical protein